MTAVVRSPSALTRLRSQLSDRDMGVLRATADCRLLTGRMIQRWWFPAGPLHTSVSSATRVTNRVLARLVQHGLLVRLMRRVGGVRAGSSGATFALGPVGQRVLEAEAPRIRYREPSALFAAHTLASAGVLVELVEADRRGDLSLVSYKTEPSCHRPFTSDMGVAEVLKPDLFVVIASGLYEYHWWVEVDMGTTHLPALLRKATIYERYFRTGNAQRERRVFPRTAWLATTPQRQQGLTTALATEPTLPAQLFVVGDLAAPLSVLLPPEATT